MDSNKITIILPMYNGELTLPNTLRSLNDQKNKHIISKLILINDASKDKTKTLIKKFVNDTSYNTLVINHKLSKGLAASYNEGIKLSTSDFVLTMHQDIIVNDNNSYKKMLDSINNNVMAVYPILEHSRELWNTYNLWQKCLFSRHIDRKEYDLTGKYDCFNRDRLEEIGYFDSSIYRTAGEDADLKHKITKNGCIFKCSNVEVLHAQENDKSFTISKYFKKEAQLAEARGVVLRKHGTGNVKSFVSNFFREGMLIAAFVPIINIPSILIICAYGFLYTKNVYVGLNILDSFKVFVANILLLFVNIYFSTKGFLSGVQKI